jgi:hypothetical protein
VAEDVETAQMVMASKGSFNNAADEARARLGRQLLKDAMKALAK